MKREIINESELGKIIGGVDYTVKQEPDPDIPGHGTGYIYADGVLEFEFTCNDANEFEDTIRMYMSTGRQRRSAPGLIETASAQAC